MCIVGNLGGLIQTILTSKLNNYITVKLLYFYFFEIYIFLKNRKNYLVLILLTSTV